MAVTCVTPRAISKESNSSANERKKEACQANGNVTGLADEERIQNGLFTAKEHHRGQNWMVSINTGPVQWHYVKKKEERSHPQCYYVIIQHDTQWKCLTQAQNLASSSL